MRDVVSSGSCKGAILDSALMSAVLSSIGRYPFGGEIRIELYKSLYRMKITAMEEQVDTLLD